FSAHTAGACAPCRAHAAAHCCGARSLHRRTVRCEEVCCNRDAQSLAPSTNSGRNPRRDFSEQHHPCWTDSRRKNRNRSPAPEPASADTPIFLVSSSGNVSQEVDVEKERHKRTRDKLRQLLIDGQLEQREVEIEVSQSGPVFDMMIPQGAPEGMENFSDMLQDMLPKRT